MKEKSKKLYFTNDFSLENVKKLQDEGWIIRNAQLAKSDSFVEQADEYGGDIPNRYKIKSEQITVSLNTETTPELQQAIDDAKAECEKVVAENKDLIGQLNKEREAVKKLTAEKEALLLQVKELEAKVKKPTAAELKAAKEAEQNKE